MQRQDRLLFFGLDRDRLDAWLLDRCPDRPNVVRIVLVAAYKGSNCLRRQQPDLVVELPDPTRPVLCAAARFHRDQAGRAVGEVLQELRPTRTLRPGQALRQAQEGHLAPPPAKGLATRPQSIKSRPSRASMRMSEHSAGEPLHGLNEQLLPDDQRHCHVNRRWRHRTTMTPFQVAALAQFHTMKTSVGVVTLTTV